MAKFIYYWDPVEFWTHFKQPRPLKQGFVGNNFITTFVTTYEEARGKNACYSRCMGIRRLRIALRSDF